eukprot:m.66174 g.66174  ORF g.66174 m.66174 type:complete len:808 (-) comp7610_c0_seq4:86-2509(-)
MSCTLCLAVLGLVCLIPGAIAECAQSPRPSGFPSDVNFAEFACTNVADGETCTVRCPDRYRVVGGTVLTCDGTIWSGTVPSCEVVECPELDLPVGAPLDTSVSCTTRTIGTTCNTQCPEPYVQQGGESRTCQIDGTWSGTRGTCTRDASIDVVENSLQLVVGEGKDIELVVGSMRLSARDVVGSIKQQTAELTRHSTELSELSDSILDVGIDVTAAQQAAEHATDLAEAACSADACNDINSSISSLRGGACASTLCGVAAQVSAVQGEGCSASVCSVKEQLDTLEGTVTTQASTLKGGVCTSTLCGLSSSLEALKGTGCSDTVCSLATRLDATGAVMDAKIAEARGTGCSDTICSLKSTLESRLGGVCSDATLCGVKSDLDSLRGTGCSKSVCDLSSSIDAHASMLDELSNSIGNNREAVAELADNFDDLLASHLNLSDWHNTHHDILSTLIADEERERAAADEILDARITTLGTSISTTLQDYAKMSDLNAYATTAVVDGVVDTLGDYLKSSDLDLSPYAKLSDLADYATASSVSDLSSSLANYALQSSLSAYALKADLTGLAKTSDLSAYALKTDLNGYATTSSLSSLATTASVSALEARIVELETKVASINLHHNDGWQLIMKIKSGSTLFQYSSEHWSTASTLNEFDLTLDAANAKYPTFNTMAFTQIRICVGEPTINCHAVELPQRYANAIALFNGPYLRGYVDQTLFQDVFGVSGQADCGMQRPGFNTVGKENCMARWGFINNVPSQACQTSDASDSDGTIGIGISGQNPQPWGAGWTGFFNTDDNSNPGESRDVWLWVKA